MNTKELQTGDLVFIEVVGDNRRKWYRKFLTKTIAFITSWNRKPTSDGRNITHVGFLVIVDGDLYISESEKRGPRNKPLGYYTNNKNYNVIIKRYNKAEPWVSGCFETIAFTYPGNYSYDYAGLAGHLSAELSEMATGKEKWLKNKKKVDKVVCSHYACLPYNLCYGLFPSPWQWSPVEMFDHPEFETIKVIDEH